MKGALASKRDSSQVILTQEFTQLKERGRHNERIPCTCGKCNCYKRHHCPLHHGVVARAIGPQEKTVNKNPLSEYKSTFCDQFGSFLPHIQATKCNTSFQIPLHKEGRVVFPTIKRRKMCPPFPDQLFLFRGKPLSSDTEQRVAYPKWNNQPLTLSCKQEEKYHISDAPFVGESQLKSDYQPVLHEDIAMIHLDVNARAAETAKIYRHGMHIERDKRKPTVWERPVNQTEYFQFNRLKPRVKYGDRFERLYHYYPHQSDEWGDAITETQACFIPKQGKRSESCKPLDVRINEERNYDARFYGDTSYNDDYIVRELPKRNVCPAELIQSYL